MGNNKLSSRRLGKFIVGCVLAIIVIAATVTSAHLVDSFKSIKVRDARAAYDGRVLKAREEYAQAVRRAAASFADEQSAAQKAYLLALDENLLAATKSGDLDEALKLRTARDDLKAAGPISPDGTPTRKIPADALTFNGHRYKAFISKISWHRAKRQCELLGGHLVCINSEAEQKFIAEQFCQSESKFWTGGTDEVEEGVWKWLDGTRFTYKIWENPQPDNQGGYGDYLIVAKGGGWNDFHASGLWMAEQFVHGFICEWE